MFSVEISALHTESSVKPTITNILYQKMLNFPKKEKKKNPLKIL